MIPATTGTMNGSWSQARIIGQPGAAIGVALAVLAIAGCGESAGPDYRPPLASLQGTITGATVPITGDVRMAVMWFGLGIGDIGDGGVDQDAGGFPFPLPFTITAATQDVPLVPKFPARFRIDLDRVPSLDAVPRLDDFGYSIGVIIVYDDRNGNGRLDVGGATDTDADRFLGAPTDVGLVYLENHSGVQLPSGPESPIGFTLFRTHALDVPPPCSEPEAAPKTEPLPIDTPIEIPLNGGGFPFMLCGDVQPIDLTCDPSSSEDVQCNGDYSGWKAMQRLAVGTPCEQLVPCSDRMCPPPATRPDYCKQQQM